MLLLFKKMSNNYEEDRLNKDLEDAKSEDEKNSIKDKYERGYTRSFKVLLKQNNLLKKEMELVRKIITKNDCDKYCHILMKYEEEQQKLLKEQEDQLTRVLRFL